jgi:hypothetical protein
VCCHPIPPAAENSYLSPANREPVLYTDTDRLLSPLLSLSCSPPAAENSYLSPANGEPVLYINIEDHVSYATGRTNDDFQAIMQILRSPVCSGRLHWWVWQGLFCCPGPLRNLESKHSPSVVVLPCLLLCLGLVQRTYDRCRHVTQCPSPSHCAVLLCPVWVYVCVLLCLQGQGWLAGARGLLRWCEGISKVV